MIMWVLMAVFLTAEGDLDGMPLKEFSTFEECSVEASKLRALLLTSRPVDVPVETQAICWPQPKVPKAKPSKGELHASVR